MAPQGNDNTITALKGDAPSIWAEIDLQAIAHNVRELRRYPTEGTFDGGG